MTLDDQVQPTGDEAGESVGGVIRRGIRRRWVKIHNVGLNNGLIPRSLIRFYDILQY